MIASFGRFFFFFLAFVLLAHCSDSLSSPSLFSQHLSPKFKTILSDIDGTLLDSNHAMADTTVNAIHNVMQSGFNFFPCTGRSRESMAAAVGPAFLRLFHPSGDPSKIPGVYQQGLQVYDTTGALIHERLLPAETIQIVEQFCAEQETSLIAYCGSQIFTVTQTVQTRGIVEYKEPIPTLMSSIPSLSSSTPSIPHLRDLFSLGHPVHKLIILSDDAELSRLRPALSTLMQGKASITKAVPNMLEVLPLGASKGAGVSVLLESLGIDAEDVIAFGDGENDVEMLGMVGLGVAVKNAKEGLKRAAKVVLQKSNDQMAVAECMGELLQYRVKG